MKRKLPRALLPQYRYQQAPHSFAYSSICPIILLTLATNRNVIAKQITNIHLFSEYRNPILFCVFVLCISQDQIFCFDDVLICEFFIVCFCGSQTLKINNLANILYIEIFRWLTMIVG